MNNDLLGDWRLAMIESCVIVAERRRADGAVFMVVQVPDPEDNAARRSDTLIAVRASRDEHGVHIHTTLEAPAWLPPRAEIKIDDSSIEVVAVRTAASSAEVHGRSRCPVQTAEQLVALTFILLGVTEELLANGEPHGAAAH
jgi:hypothetical protein